jgi:CBS-domain-containing membrane protein
MSSAQQFIKEYPTCCLAYAQLEHALVNNDREALGKVIPSLITHESALNSSSSRSAALRKMLDLKVDTLPVVDDHQKLVGMVDKASISSSLLLEIANSIEQK